MKKEQRLSKKEQIIYTIGMVILIVLICQGLWGVLTAAAILGWLTLMSGEKEEVQKEEKAMAEEQQRKLRIAPSQRMGRQGEIFAFPGTQEEESYREIA